MIELKHITKKYGKKTVLNNISLQFQDGIYGLLGPNGAGKTTLMRIIASVLEANTGEILIDGNKIDNLRMQIGYLPQRFSFYHGLTVDESLQHVAYMKNMNPKEIKFEVNKVISEVNLSEKRNERVGTLSGGMLRRLV